MCLCACVQGHACIDVKMCRQSSMNVCVHEMYYVRMHVNACVFACMHVGCTWTICIQADGVVVACAEYVHV